MKVIGKSTGMPLSKPYIIGNPDKITFNTMIMITATHLKTILTAF